MVAFSRIAFALTVVGISSAFSPTDVPSGVAMPSGRHHHHHSGTGYHSRMHPRPSGYAEAKDVMQSGDAAPYPTGGFASGVAMPSGRPRYGGFGGHHSGMHPSGMHHSGMMMPSGEHHHHMPMSTISADASGYDKRDMKPSGSPPSGPRPTGPPPSGPRPTGPPPADAPPRSGFVTSTRRM